MKCPKCKSTNIDQYRTIIGAIWCNNCGFRAEQKERHNPFVMPPTSDNSDYAVQPTASPKLPSYIDIRAYMSQHGIEDNTKNFYETIKKLGNFA